MDRQMKTKGSKAKRSKPTQKEVADVNGALNSQDSTSGTQRPLVDPNPDKHSPQYENLAKAHPTSSANYRARVSENTETTDESRDDIGMADRDPQQIMDDNLSQYTTGQPT